MATWVIGDVQGCFEPLQRLLAVARFDVAQDRLWFLGDLVNRGPASLEVLRFARGLGERALVTLGNHDLHLLAVYYGGHSPKRKDTLSELLNAPDVDSLCDWLRRCPLAHYDESSDTFLAHAGLPHIWAVDTALARAREVETVLRGPDYVGFLQSMYGDDPACWHDDLRAIDRLRAITNYFTRMRWIRADGELEFRHKDALSERPAGYHPWFERRHRDSRGVRVLFGHWAALDGLAPSSVPVVALDTGCVWGRRLSALRLDDGAIVQVPATAAS